MRMSTIMSLVVSIGLAVVAVFGVRTYLAGQRDLLAARAGLVSTPKNTSVVAARALRFGQPIKAEDLKTLAWPTGELPAGAFEKIDELVGKDEAETRYVMSAIEKDEPVLAAKVTGAGQRATLSAALTEGMKAVSIRVNDVVGVAGFVLPGDRVDIMLTRRREAPEGEQTFVDVLLQGVKVLAVDQTADDRADKPDVAKTVTFEVTTAEAQKLTLAASVGTLSLALRNVASSGVEQVSPVTVADLGGGPAAEALREAKAQEEEDQSAARLGALESLVRTVGDTLGNRIGSVEEKLNQKPAQIVVEKQVPVEKLVVVEPPKPKFVVIGVSRNTKREEYQVKQLP